MIIVIEMNVWALVGRIALAIDQWGQSGPVEMKQGVWQICVEINVPVLAFGKDKHVTGELLFWLLY